MKIIIQSLETEVSITLSDESDIYEVGEKLKGLLVAYGFHPNNVDELIDVERWGKENGDDSKEKNL